MHLIQHTAAWFGVTSQAIVGYRREKHLVRARHVCAYVMRKRTGLSYPQIGRVLNRDHSSIIHGCKNVWYALDNDPEIERAVAHLMQVEFTRFRPPGLGPNSARGKPVRRIAPPAKADPVVEIAAPEPVAPPAYTGKAKNDFDSGTDPKTKESLFRAKIRNGSDALLAALLA